MIVLHLLAPAPAGGLERVVGTLSRGLRGWGHEVHIGAIVEEVDGRLEMLAPLAEYGVRIHTLLVPPRGYRHERTRVAELCRSVQPDLIHTHGYRPDVLDIGVAQRLRIPVVSTVHGFTGGGWRVRAYERLQRLALRRCDAVVAVSHPLAESLVHSGVASARVHTIPNAWDGAVPLDRRAARGALELPESAFVIGWVGRLSEEKGPDLLLDAVKRLAPSDAIVSIIGDGPLAGVLRERSAREGGGRIRWHGAVSDAARLFPAFDVFVLSSRTEGTPIVLFEAMAAHVPIVATTVGGVEGVVSAETAYLVAPDDPAELATALRRVRADREFALQRATAALHRLLTHFRPEPWVERYLGVYARASRRRSPVPC